MRRLYGLAAFLLVVTLVLAGCRGAPEAPAEPYKVGVTGAITGPAAVTAVGKNEGFRIFFQKLNEEGGIDGRQVQVMIEDDRAEPPRAQSNMRKFIEQGVHIVYNNSMSSSYPPTIAEARRANIPVVFTTIAPKESLPPNPDPLFYKAGYTFGPKSTFLALDVIKKMAEEKGETPKIGLLAMEIPISKLGVELLHKEAQRMGLDSMMKVVPLGTVDMTPVAQAFMDWGANWTYYFGPGGVYAMLIDSMKKAGWEGTALDLGVIMPFEMGMKKYKGQPFYLDMIPYLPLSDNLPEHQEITAAAQKYGVASIDSTLIQGWYDGKAIAEILRQAGWPLTTEKLTGVMQNFQFDRRPIMPPIKWTPQDHAGFAYFRAYHWVGDKIEPVGPWFASNAAGTERFTVESLEDIK
jgi:branched-chain amino acid transport system substrate-binding protein